MNIPTPPYFNFLRDAAKKSFLIELRAHVAPILANNLLPYFTDHSIDHSDALIGIVDNIIAPIQDDPSRQLTQIELQTLYAACYMHDIGMHYENIGNTKTISDIHLGVPWEELSEMTRRNYLRKYHHLISAEIVFQASQEATTSPIEYHFTNQHHSESIAALCEAHGIDVDSERFSVLCPPDAVIRLNLLAGLLRVADILDEKRTRAEKVKRNALLLEVESKSHWWRHYFTEDITFDRSVMTITIHFDFPNKKIKEYSDIIPNLQLPWVQSELSKHIGVFGPLQLNWTIARSIKSKPYSTTEEMPDDVLAEMLRQLNDIRNKDISKFQLIAIQAFRESKPYIQRRLSDLESYKKSHSDSENLKKTWEIAQDFQRIGESRNCWFILCAEFERLNSTLATSDERIKIGLWIAKALLYDKVYLHANRILQIIAPDVNLLLENSDLKHQYYILKVQSLLSLGIHDEAAAALISKISNFPALTKEEILSLYYELQFLHGDFLAMRV